MRVVVATVEGIPSSAHLALRAEGIEHETPTPTGVFGYWELLSRLWDDGEGFILLEHDVTPWPGSIQLLRDCPEEWCVHEYPYGEPPMLLWSLGVCKFTTDFIEDHQGLMIPQIRWEQLDHFARGVLNEDGPPHIHEPPFAHARLKDRGE